MAKKRKFLQSGVWGKTKTLTGLTYGRTARQRRNDAFPRRVRGGEGGAVRRRRRRRVKMSSDVAAVMKREANDWRQEVERRRTG